MNQQNHHRHPTAVVISDLCRRIRGASRSKHGSFCLGSLAEAYEFYEIQSKYNASFRNARKPRKSRQSRDKFRGSTLFHTAWSMECTTYQKKVRNRKTCSHVKDRVLHWTLGLNRTRKRTNWFTIRVQHSKVLRECHYLWLFCIDSEY